MAVVNKNFIKKHTHRKQQNGDKYIYTVTKNISPFTVQLDQKKNIKSSVIGFGVKADAVRFAHLLETYHESNYMWPLLNLESDTFNMILFTNSKTQYESDLKILQIHAWESDSIVTYCKYNILNLAILNEKKKNMIEDYMNNNYIDEDDYIQNDIINGNYGHYGNNIIYITKVYNVISTIENQKSIYEYMLNKDTDSDPNIFSI
jgi:hypothetical protein